MMSAAHRTSPIAGGGKSAESCLHRPTLTRWGEDKRDEGEVKEGGGRQRSRKSRWKDCGRRKSGEEERKSQKRNEMALRKSRSDFGNKPGSTGRVQRPRLRAARAARSAQESRVFLFMKEFCREGMANATFTVRGSQPRQSCTYFPLGSL